MLDCRGKCTAVLGQEGEIVGTPITHIKAEAAKFGLGLVFQRVWEAHHWKMWHASGSMQNLSRVINFGNSLLYFHYTILLLKCPLCIFRAKGYARHTQQLLVAFQVQLFWPPTASGRGRRRAKPETEKL